MMRHVPSKITLQIQIRGEVLGLQMRFAIAFYCDRDCVNLEDYNVRELEDIYIYNILSTLTVSREDQYKYPDTGRIIVHRYDFILSITQSMQYYLAMLSKYTHRF